jgi:hypothetical protein
MKVKCISDIFYFVKKDEIYEAEKSYNSYYIKNIGFYGQRHFELVEETPNQKRKTWPIQSMEICFDGLKEFEKLNNNHNENWNRPDYKKVERHEESDKGKASIFFGYKEL